MINAKVKIFNEEYPSSLESSINEFLKTIDVRQIIKTEYSSGASVGQYLTIRTTLFPYTTLFRSDRKSVV